MLSKLILISTLSLVGCLLASCPTYAQGHTSSKPIEVISASEQLLQAKENVKDHPTDAKARYQLAEILRLGHHDVEAASEYLEAVSLDPTMYIAFHRIATINADASQVNEAIEYASELNEEKPKEFFLRIALSELLEKRGDYYEAARVLVDVVYVKNVIPVRYQQSTNARIHYLLAQTREAGKHVEPFVATQHEQLDTLLPPLPKP